GCFEASPQRADSRDINGDTSSMAAWKTSAARFPPAPPPVACLPFQPLPFPRSIEGRFTKRVRESHQ
ncbi:hypothetical protein OAE02_02475, partial [Akkermansiaceae bacterium]|nr:hypothetical protein [Akkermansiaceae bacterium]